MGNDNSKTLSAKTETALPWILNLIGFAGDIIKFIMRFDPPLTSSRLKNMQTGGNYPIENTKEYVAIFLLKLKMPFSKLHIGCIKRFHKT